MGDTLEVLLLCLEGSVQFCIQELVSPMPVSHSVFVGFGWGDPVRAVGQQEACLNKAVSGKAGMRKGFTCLSWLLGILK